MPSSVLHGKNIIKKWFEKQKDIKSIIDVGAGKGTYPKLLEDNYYWTAVEIFEPYVEMWGLEDIYDEIIIGNILTVNLPDADCIIFGDVIEHLEYDDAMNVVAKALDNFQHVVISVPIGENTWGKVHYSNEFEKHLSIIEFDEIYDLVNWEIAEEVRGIGVFII